MGDIKFLDLEKQYSSIKEEIETALKKVLENGIFIGGEEVEKFEKEIADFCGVKYALGVNSGTDALFLSLKGLGIKEGDEVITTPFTFISTAEVIANLGATPVFADINETLNISPSEIEKKITEKTRAIIPVHLFGLPCKMDEILEIARKHNLYVIEDAAQAIGAEHKDRKVGSMGNFGCFSFFPTKNLGAFGDGGMIVTNNGELAEKIKLLRNHGSSSEDKYKNLILGTNSRLDAVQAAFLRIKLKYLEEWNEKRKKLSVAYNKGLAGLKQIKTPEGFSVFNCYTIRAERRDELKDYLEKQGIETKIYYSLCLHLQPALNFVKKENFPEAEKASREVLSIPIYPELSEKDQKFIIEKIKKFYE